MKKTMIAVLVVLLLCTSASFAATYDSGYNYGEPKLDDFFGLSVGSSFVYETYESASGKTVDKALQVYAGLSEFAFFGDATLGVYFDAGVLINIKDNYNPDEVKKAPAYADLSLGLAYRTKMDGRTSFLLAAAPEFTYFTDQYAYKDEYDDIFTHAFDALTILSGTQHVVQLKETEQ